MAVVPTQNLRTVSLPGAPNTYDTVQSTPDEFGALEGKALSQVGAQLTSVGNDWMASAQRQEEDAAKVNLDTFQQSMAVKKQDLLDNWNPTTPGFVDTYTGMLADEGNKFLATVPDGPAKRDISVRLHTWATREAVSAAGIQRTFAINTAETAIQNKVNNLSNAVRSQPTEDNFNSVMQDVAADIGSSPIPFMQKRDILQAHTQVVAQAVAQGMIEKGQEDEARAFIAGLATKQYPWMNLAPAPGANSGLNAQRISAIDSNPAIAGVINAEAQKAGLDPNMVKTFIHIESSGDPNANRDKATQYKGLGQITAAEFKQYNPAGTDIFDATQNARATIALLKDRSDQLESFLGRAPTAAELYLSHQQGVGGFKALTADPQRPAWQALASTAEGRQKGEGWAKQAIWGNLPDSDKKRFGSVENVTSGDFTSTWASKVQGMGPRSVAANGAQGVTGGYPAQQPTLSPQSPRQQPATADGQVPGQPPAPAGDGKRAQIPGVNIQYVADDNGTYGRSATANAKPFSAIVAHYTGGNSLEAAMNTLKGDPSRGGNSYGYHFYVDKDGTIYQGVPMDKRTNHVKGANAPQRSSRPDITNEDAIGISFVGNSNNPTPAQLAAGRALAKGLMQQYGVPAENVVGHGQIQSADREKDEGMALVNAVNAPDDQFGNGATVRLAQAVGATANDAGAPVYGQAPGLTGKVVGQKTTAGAALKANGKMMEWVEQSISKYHENQKKQAKDYGDSLLKDLYDKQANHTVTDDDIEKAKPYISPEHYQNLKRSLVPGSNNYDDPDAVIDLNSHVTSDSPEEFQQRAAQYLRSGQLKTDTFNTFSSRNNTAWNERSPQNPYKSGRNLVQDTLDPGSLISGPAQQIAKAGMAQAVAEFDNWAAANKNTLNGNEGRAAAIAQAQDIIKRYQIVNYNDMSLSMGLSRYFPAGTDRNSVNAKMVDDAEAALVSAMPKLTREQQDFETRLLENWRGILVKKEQAARAAAAATKAQ